MAVGDMFVAMVDILEFGAVEVERYAEVLTQTAQAVARADRDAAIAALHPIAGEIWMGRLTTANRSGSNAVRAARRVGNETLRAQVFVRDRFRCTCCGGRAIPRSILVAIHDLFPDQVSYDVHYTRGKMHPVFWALAPEADHVLAHSRGGANELNNLTTLHAACNTRKSDTLIADMPLLDTRLRSDDWDGLTSLYPALISAGAGEMRPTYHRTWSRRYAALMP
ncbi:HNH endonuclease [Microbacterium sp. LMI12-1-1.1]|uniref:HNH endonuclease n=1 Tax=Microbacterium sp. LMI12-1-1.1 TaxID=3135225 RepID=UPI00344214AF